MLATGILAITYLQFRFDQSDLKNAVGAVRLARPGGHDDSTLEEKIQKKYGVRPDLISWIPEIESKITGKVKVRALLPQGDKNLIYQVDLVRLSVNPLTPEAEELSQIR